MFKTGEKSHLCQNDETFFCSNLYRSVEITDLYRSLQSQTITIPYSKLTAFTKKTSINYVVEILRKQYFIKTSTTHRVATCQILSVKTKSIWQTSLSKFNNHFWKVRVKWINYRVLPKPHFRQSPKLP